MGQNTPSAPQDDKEKGTRNEQTDKVSAALAPVQSAANLVLKYASRLVDDDRAQQFYAQVFLMAKGNEKLAKCSPDSFLASVMACVHLDLMPNTPEQYAFIIPYWNERARSYEAQFQLGYKGLVELAWRSNQLKAISAELVYEGDTFKVSLGTDRRITHDPKFEIDRTDYSKVTHAYLVAKLTTGETVFEVMTRSELDKIQKSAKAKSTDAPWNTWPAEMAKKTVVKRASKLLPKARNDNRLSLAAQIDNWAEAGKLKISATGDVIEGETVDNGDAEQKRRDNIKAAEAAAKEFDQNDFTPTAVATNDAKTEGESGGADKDTENNEPPKSGPAAVPANG